MHRDSVCSKNLRKAGKAVATFVIAMILGAGTIKPLHAQSYSVIHNFTGGPDGANPFAGLTIDAAGNLYGTAFAGGSGYGTVFELTSMGSDWVVKPLYRFSGGDDGAGPSAKVVFAPDGSLMGSTSAGGMGGCINQGGYFGCGIVFKLLPPLHVPASFAASWTSTALFRFSGDDGAYPQGDLAFDQAGSIYGTTINGGSAGYGVVYQLTPSGGGWTENLVYQPRGRSDGQYPWGGVIIDASSNLYGVFANNGPAGYGAVYCLRPSGSGWTESTLHGFSYGHDGAIPEGGLIMDQSGNLYGTTVHDPVGGGTAFELSPSGDGWSYNFIYGFTGGIDLGPSDKLAMDPAGNLYGTTFADGPYNYGTVFKLSRSQGGWTYTALHNFTGGSDGANPISSLVFDSNGNLYGTASRGGSNGLGVVFEITP